MLAIQLFLWKIHVFSRVSTSKIMWGCPSDDPLKDTSHFQPLILYHGVAKVPPDSITSCLARALLQLYNLFKLKMSVIHLSMSTHVSLFSNARFTMLSDVMFTRICSVGSFLCAFLEIQTISRPCRCNSWFKN